MLGGTFGFGQLCRLRIPFIPSYHRTREGDLTRGSAFRTSSVVPYRSPAVFVRNFERRRPQQARAERQGHPSDKCGRCHAVEAVGESPLKTAPPMRDIYARFEPRELQAELLEGKVSKHKEMPQIEFSQEDVDAILAYLYALAVGKSDRKTH